MGKDLRGKELGKNISQRKDGLYTARFTDRLGKRRQQYFKKLQDCRQWLADAQSRDEHGGIYASDRMTVSAWFGYWIENIKSINAKKNTVANYKARFRASIEPVLGNMLLKDVLPLHCQNVLNQMVISGHKNATISLTRTAMKMLFEDAVENDIIVKNPVNKTVNCTQGQDSMEKTAMSPEIQRVFLEAAKDSRYYWQYAFVLQTGLRVGEMVGLKWSDIDFDNRIMTISRTMNQLDGDWVVGSPKSKAGTRQIPLTDEALSILKAVKEKRVSADVVPIQFHDTVFVSRKGNPVDNSSYNAALRKICDDAGIPHISMHTLRHTFATRCIEGGMMPKTLQVILGHSKINVTMEIYVHVMEDTKVKEMDVVASALKVV
ncbi:MAG: site-specific integrase [Eubacterium sp.]|nr:site-specific integrase [Eubacterium sp.]